MKKYLFLLFALVLGLASCTDGPEYGDAVYVTGTLSSPNVKFLVDGQSSLGLTVSSSAKASSDVKVKLAVDPNKIAEYNAANGREAILPPDGSYTLEGNEVTISAGTAQSNAIKLDADADKLQEGQAYCLPVSITDVQGDGLSALSSGKTAYIVFTKVISVKAADLMKSNSMDIKGFAGDDSPVKALTQMTLEMKFMPKSFGGISSLMGCEENFLFRFGDAASIADNVLQLAKASIGQSPDPDKKQHYEAVAKEPFETGQWHHFAAVYDGSWLRVYVDGVQIQGVETQGGTINLSIAYNGHDWNDTFSIGRSVGYSRMFNGYVSEARVWTVARTVQQLQDGVCYVDPTTPGLLAYWRFNGEVQDDGTILDETGHGYNATPHQKTTWVDNQKCPF